MAMQKIPAVVHFEQLTGKNPLSSKSVEGSALGKAGNKPPVIAKK